MTRQLCFAFSGFGYLHRQLHLLSHPELCIKELRPGVFSFQVSSPRLFKKPLEKRVVIGDEQIEVLSTGEKIKVTKSIN
jgi:hypothetical protein